MKDVMKHILRINDVSLDYYYDLLDKARRVPGKLTGSWCEEHGQSLEKIRKEQAEVIVAVEVKMRKVLADNIGDILFDYLMTLEEEE